MKEQLDDVGDVLLLRKGFLDPFRNVVVAPQSGLVNATKLVLVPGVLSEKDGVFPGSRGETELLPSYADKTVFDEDRIAVWFVFSSYEPR